MRESPERLQTPPLDCLSHRLEDEQSSRSLICVFSLSGSLSRPYWSALIKSGFSISIAACSMRSKAPGWQSPLLSATLTHHDHHHTHTRMKLHLHLRYWCDGVECDKATHEKLLLKLLADHLSVPAFAEHPEASYPSRETSLPPDVLFAQIKNPSLLSPVRKNDIFVH